MINGTEWNDANMGDYSVAMGLEPEASGSSFTAMGYYTTASGDYSTAMGRYSKAESRNSFALGRYNVGGGSAALWVSTDPLFEIGIGVDINNKANAMTVLKNGRVGIGTATPNSKLSIVGLSEYADNTAALAASLVAGDLYRTGDLLKIIH